MYLEAVKKEKQDKSIKFPVFTDDFFPLVMQHPGHVWSGYYSSRPGFKKMIKSFSHQSFISMFQYSMHILAQNDFKPTWQIALNDL